MYHGYLWSGMSKPAPVVESLAESEKGDKFVAQNASMEIIRVLLRLHRCSSCLLSQAPRYTGTP